MCAGVSSAWCCGAGKLDRPEKRDESDMTAAQLTRRAESMTLCFGRRGPTPHIEIAEEFVALFSALHSGVCGVFVCGADEDEELVRALG